MTRRRKNDDAEIEEQRSRMNSRRSDEKQNIVRTVVHKTEQQQWEDEGKSY